MQRCNRLRSVVQREDYSPIFNGESASEERHRFFARGELWAPSVERDLEQALDREGLLDCSDGQKKSVADLGALLYAGRCEICMESAVERGATDRAFSPGSGKQFPASVRYGCRICKVYVCRKCKEDGSYDNWRHPGDIYAISPALLREYIVAPYPLPHVRPLR